MDVEKRDEMREALMTLEADWRKADPANERRFWLTESSLNAAGRGAKNVAYLDLLESLLSREQLLAAFGLMRRKPAAGQLLAEPETELEAWLKPRLLAWWASFETLWLYRN